MFELILKWPRRFSHSTGRVPKAAPPVEESRYSARAGRGGVFWAGNLLERPPPAFDVGEVALRQSGATRKNSSRAL